MRRQSERFLPFLNDDAALTGNMISYVEREVEPMGKECEQVQIIALTEYLGVRCIIEYMDGRTFNEETGLSSIETETGDVAFTVVLLYRPGHYDILVKNII